MRSEWIMYLYASQTRVGTIAQNDVSCVPLTEFPVDSLDDGLPKSPQWLKLYSMGLFVIDAGEVEREQRGGGIMVTIGDMYLGGELKLAHLYYTNTQDRADYYRLLRMIRHNFVYLYMGGYTGGEEIIASPLANAMRLVLTNDGTEADGARKTVVLQWVKSTPEVF